MNLDNKGYTSLYKTHALLEKQIHNRTAAGCVLVLACVAKFVFFYTDGSQETFINGSLTFAELH